MPKLAGGNHWVQTFTGRAFNLLDPRAKDVDIRDIAHGLAQQCRFNGHTRAFSSVAEHSICVMLFTVPKLACIRYGSPPFPPWTLLAALLHDAHETYLGDMPRPLKHVPELRTVYLPIEERVQQAIHEAVGLPWPVPEEVRLLIAHADNLALALEKRDQMCTEPRAWAPLPELPVDLPRGINLLKPMAPAEAEIQFLHQYWERQRELSRRQGGKP